MESRKNNLYASIRGEPRPNPLNSTKTNYKSMNLKILGDIRPLYVILEVENALCLDYLDKREIKVR